MTFLEEIALGNLGQENQITRYCDQCCKSDTSSLWAKANLPLSSCTSTPLNQQLPNSAHVIMSTISAHVPHLVKIVPVITSPHIAKVTT